MFHCLLPATLRADRGIYDEAAFHKTKTRQAANELGSTIVYGLSDGVFRLLEWTLVIATLLYLGEKTGDGLFATVAHQLLPLVYLRQMAFMDILDIEFWRPPYHRWQLSITLVAYLMVGVVCAGGALALGSLSDVETFSELTVEPLPAINVLGANPILEGADVGVAAPGDVSPQALGCHVTNSRCQPGCDACPAMDVTSRQGIP